MKKFAKLLVLAMVVAALAAIFAIPSSATTGPVIYISNTGTGDGSSPYNPLGHGEGYVPDMDYSDPEKKNAVYTKNVMLRAFHQLGPTGGTIVIVGPVSLDTASYYTNVSGKTACELDCISWNGMSTSDPDYNVRPTITVTSKYNGVDYRTQGAKLILDHAECCSANLRLKNPGVWKDLNIEYKYDPTWLSYYNKPDQINAPYMFEADHTKQVFDTGITCTSVKVVTDSYGNKTEVPGDVYPMILGGHRQAVRSATNNTDITIKSGTWSFVSAAGYGHGVGAKSGTVKGNAKLTIEGGKIGTIYGTGSIDRAYGTVEGTVDISIRNATVGEIWLTNGEIYNGPGINLTINNTQINKANIYHSPIDGEIIPEITVSIDGQSWVPTYGGDYEGEDTSEITLPATKPAATTNKPSTSQPPAQTKPAQTNQHTPSTAIPGLEGADIDSSDLTGSDSSNPSSKKKSSNDDDNDSESKKSTDGDTVFIIITAVLAAVFAIIAVVIAIAIIKILKAKK